MNFLRLSSLLLSVATFTACGPGEALVGDADLELGDAESALALTSGRFETFVGRDGQHYFHLMAGNGERVLGSEGYTTKAAATAGIASVKANGATGSRYLQREASDGSWYFVLTAGNGQIIGVSEMYATKASATRAQTKVAQLVANTVAQGPAVEGDARFDTFRGLDGKYYFHLRSGNGQIVMQSQGYTTRASANSGIAAVQTNGTLTSRYLVLAAADGKFYFVLKAANGQTIGRGETYASKYNASRGVTTCVDLITGRAER